MGNVLVSPCLFDISSFFGPNFRMSGRADPYIIRVLCCDDNVIIITK